MMADEDDLKNLKGLSPQERIKKLKELEEKRKKEKEEADKLLKQSIEEIDMSIKEKQDIPIPQVKAASVDELTSEDEKQVFRTKRFLTKEEQAEEAPVEEESGNYSSSDQNQLEQALKAQQIKSFSEEEARHNDYISSLAQQPAVQLYDRINEIRQDIYSTGQANQSSVNDLYQLQTAIEQKKEDIKTGRYTTSEEIMAHLDNATRIVDDIMGKYKM